MSDGRNFNAEGDINLSITGDFVSGNQIINQAPLPPLSFPISNLQEANPHFIGREAHLRTLAESAASDPTTITQAIAGLGGVGKSQLMAHFAHQHRGQFDIVWWVRVDEAWAEDMIALGRALRLSVDGVDQAAALQTVRTWLCGCPQTWLLLCDNADATAPRALRPQLPSNARGRILITSRNTQWAGVAQTVAVDIFTPAESAAFWRERLGEAAAEEAARAELAEELGHLPLALEHAAAYMETKDKPAADYLRLVRDQRQKVWAHTQPPNDYHATVATTWQVSFAEVQKTAGAAELLALCACLAPDDLPLDLLQANLDLDGAEEIEFDEAVGVLCRYALVQKDGAGQWGIHRLVQAVYRDEMGEAERRELVAMAADWIVWAYKFDKHDMATWPAAARLMPHLQAVAEQMEAWGVENEQVARLNNEVGVYLTQYGQFQLAKPYYERALTIRERVFSPDHPKIAHSLSNLGELLREMGELAAARPYHERALAIYERVLGPDHPNTATSLISLGFVLKMMGELTAA